MNVKWTIQSASVQHILNSTHLYGVWYGMSCFISILRPWQIVVQSEIVVRQLMPGVPCQAARATVSTVPQHTPFVIISPSHILSVEIARLLCTLCILLCILREDSFNFCIHIKMYPSILHSSYYFSFSYFPFCSALDSFNQLCHDFPFHMLSGNCLFLLYSC